VDRRAFLRTMRTLEARDPIADWAAPMTPFEALVSTILSQSTTVGNERRGMDGLRKAFGTVTPDALAEAPIRRIERAIWHAGLSRQKAGRIRDVARIVRGRWGGSLDGVLRRRTEAARADLVSLPGVGPKTADVVLAMAGGHPTFPVDTHVDRIARRWGLVPRTDYEATRAALEAWTPPGKRKAWHLAMIAHGRTLCKARRPRCAECPVARDCDWYRARGRRRPDKRLRSPEG